MSKDVDIIKVGGDEVIEVSIVEALNAIRNKEIPKSAQKTRPGKAGQSFTYIDHGWVTETLQNGLPYMWSFEVLSWEVFRDTIKIGGSERASRSVIAQCKFTLHVPNYLDATGKTQDRVYTEVGVFEPNDSMSTAAAVASAVSRGLCRCVMRSIGLGIQFYTKDDEVTSADAWTSLKTFGSNSVGKIKWENEVESKYIEELKKAGITKDNLVNEYPTAYKILAQMLGKTQKVEEMPDV